MIKSCRDVKDRWNAPRIYVKNSVEYSLKGDIKLIVYEYVKYKKISYGKTKLQVIIYHLQISVQ